MHYGILLWAYLSEPLVKDSHKRLTGLSATEKPRDHTCYGEVHGNIASSPARAKNGEAPGTHCLRMRLISPRCGDSGLFSDSSVSCDVRVRTRYSKLIRII